MTDYRLKMGVRYGTPYFTTQGEFNADVVLSAKSGRYVVYNYGDDFWDVCGNDAAAITGYVDHSVICGGTDGDTKLPIAVNVDNFVTEMPYAAGGSAGTLSLSTLLDLIGGNDSGPIDIYATGNIQYADVANSQDLLLPVGGSVKNNTLYVTVLNADILRLA